MIKIELNNILDKKERNLNWLAKKCDISYSTLYNFAMGKTAAVSYNLLESVCTVLEVRIEDILKLER